MNTFRRTFIQAFAVAVAAVGFAATPAAAAPVVAPAPAAQCILAPGVYGIVDSSGTLVGILIVYPDCRIEVFKKQEMI